VTVLPSTAESAAILAERCRRRGLRLNKRLRHKPWRMALMIHRHDAGGGAARSRDEIDGDFRRGIRPAQHVVHQWIHANPPATMAGDDERSGAAVVVRHRFSKRMQRAASREIVRERQASYAEEAIRAAGERNVRCPPLPPGGDSNSSNSSSKREDWRTLLGRVGPFKFLNLFARAVARAERDAPPGVRVFGNSDRRRSKERKRRGGGTGSRKGSRKK
jgi:hypothetical protein